MEQKNDGLLPAKPHKRDTDPHGWAVEVIEAVLHQLRIYDKAGDILLGPEIFDLDDALKCLAKAAQQPADDERILHVIKTLHFIKDECDHEEDHRILPNICQSIAILNTIKAPPPAAQISGMVGEECGGLLVAVKSAFEYGTEGCYAEDWNQENGRAGFWIPYDKYEDIKAILSAVKDKA